MGGAIGAREESIVCLVNEYDSVAWGGSSTRYVLFNSAPDDYATYRLRFTAGTGAP